MMQTSFLINFYFVLHACVLFFFFYKEMHFSVTHEEEFFYRTFGGGQQHGGKTFIFPSRVGTLFLSYTAALEGKGKNKDSEI